MCVYVALDLHVVFCNCSHGIIVLHFSNIFTVSRVFRYDYIIFVCKLGTDPLQYLQPYSMMYGSYTNEHGLKIIAPVPLIYMF